MLRLLFAAGIPLVRSLRVLSSTIKNTVIAGEVNEMEELFRRGGELRDIIPNLRFIPEQALQMMAIGLESGNMDRTLREVGRHYLKEVSYMSRMLTTLLEPVLTVVLGAMVLVLALAIFLPMWNLIHVIKG
jgi:type II secretory pathway component PulF